MIIEQTIGAYAQPQTYLSPAWAMLAAETIVAVELPFRLEATLKTFPDDVTLKRFPSSVTLKR